MAQKDERRVITISEKPDGELVIRIGPNVTYTEVIAGQPTKRSRC